MQLVKSVITHTGKRSATQQAEETESIARSKLLPIESALDKETTYFVAAPYEKTLRRLRAAIKREGLRLPMEMDVSGRIRNELGVGLRPCSILYVDCPFLLLQAAVWGGCGAAFLPLRVVVSENGAGTRIRLPGPVYAGIPPGLRGPFEGFVRRFLRILDETGATRVDDW